MKRILVLLLFVLAGCNGTKTPPVEPTEPVIKTGLEVSPIGFSSTWYEIPQYYDGVPKYSGAFGTYTAKHTPIAVQYDGVVYYTFSDNSEGPLRIYVSNSFETVMVHQTVDIHDPHSNATISIDSDGHLWVFVSARARMEIGAVYRSKEPGALDFDKIEDSWRAYPQPWETPNGQILLYTSYDETGGSPKYVRQLYSDGLACDGLKLVEGGHYQVSIYGDGYVHTFYNMHPDGNVDKRANLYYMKSANGCDWLNASNQPIELPLALHSDVTLVYDSIDRNTYLKDIWVDSDGPGVMFVESDTRDPTQGERELYLMRLGTSPEKITDIGHNYTTGFYNSGYIVTPLFGEDYYASGALELWAKKDGTWQSLNVIDGRYNYARKVHGSNSRGVVSIDYGGSAEMATLRYNF